MKIALIGYGKLGHLIEEVARSRGHEVSVKIDSRNVTTLLNEEGLREVDICIDFSRPECLVDHVKRIAALKKPIVVGTTGWYRHLQEVKSLVEESGIGFLYAPNFSIGMLLFMRFVAHAAEVMNRFPEYDAAGFESHHNQKVDTPSGTGEALAQIVLDSMERKSAVVYDLMGREIAPCEFHLASLRCGHDPGVHSIVFDGPTDTITLTHRNRSRMGLAQGALLAAEWLRHRTGFFSLEEMVGSVL